MKTTQLIIVLAMSASAAAVILPAAADDLPGPGEPTLAEVRTATEKYQDVKVALAEGYIRDPANMCETADMMGRPASDGAMGVHYFRPDLLGITAPPNPRVDGNGTHTDFHAPAILIYEPQADGSMHAIYTGMAEHHRHDGDHPHAVNVWTMFFHWLCQQAVAAMTVQPTPGSS